MSSENISQIYTNNPSTSVGDDDLFYVGQSPYGSINDTAIKYSDLSYQIITDIGVVSSTQGGTGISNNHTITVGGTINFINSFTTTGNFPVTQNYTASTNVTFPTSGTLATTSQIPTGEALTETNDTNVTLTLGGSSSTALVNAASITAGWTGTLSLDRGGTGNDLTSSPGAIVYCNALSGGMFFSPVGSGGQILRSGGTSNPSWTSSTYPSNAGASGTLMTSDGTNYINTTAEYPSTSGGSGTLLTSDGSNFVNTTAQYPSTATLSGQILISSPPNWIASTAAYPLIAGTSGTILRSNGTNIVNSTATYPGTAGTSGTLLTSDGTNIVNTTSTYPTTNAVSTILYASSANTMAALATANNGVLVTSSGGVPSISSTLPSGISATNMGLTTPSLGAATATSINGNIITSGTGTLTVGANNNITSPTRSTYSPILQDSAGNSFTMSAQKGTYIIYGNVYFIWIDIAWSAKGSAVSSNFVEITLPITISSQTDRPTFSIAAISGVTATALTAGGVAGNTYISIYNYTGTNTASLTVASISTSGFLQLSGFVGV